MKRSFASCLHCLPTYGYSVLGLSMSPRCFPLMATWIYNSPKVICKTAGGNVLQVQIVSLPSCVQVSMSTTWMLNLSKCVCVQVRAQNVNAFSMSFWYAMRPDDACPNRCKCPWLRHCTAFFNGSAVKACGNNHVVLQRNSLAQGPSYGLECLRRLEGFGQFPAAALAVGDSKSLLCPMLPQILPWTAAKRTLCLPHCFLLFQFVEIWLLRESHTYSVPGPTGL